MMRVGGTVERPAAIRETASAARSGFESDNAIPVE
jgi:hypothetical protein